MDLSRVIVGPVVTEKAERQKVNNTYTLRVHPDATKIDVKNALKRFYDLEASSVRVLRTVPKTRLVGQSQVIEKRHREKRMLVTLPPKSKPLDLSTFKTS